MSWTMTPPSEEEREQWEEQKRKWEAHEAVCLAKNVCPHSGLEGPECKSWLCDCFDYTELWGHSQK